jgi:hypothetical protein
LETRAGIADAAEKLRTEPPHYQGRVTRRDFTSTCS